tara:strand:+ start:51 stop:344 length:294 start_codon:yes stop_codon:yes gene_type:complete
MDLFKNLPIELQSKILYKNGLIEQTAKIMRSLIDTINEWRNMRWDPINNCKEDISFYDILVDLHCLKNVSNTIIIDELVNMIMDIHFEEYSSSDDDL